MTGTANPRRVKALNAKLASIDYRLSLCCMDKAASQKMETNNF